MSTCSSETRPIWNRCRAVGTARRTEQNVAEEITRGTLCSDTTAIMRRVEAGETFVITDGGVLIAELRPISGPHFVTRDQIRAVFTGGPPVDFEKFRQDLERPGDRVHPTGR